MRVIHIIPGIDQGASARLKAEHSRALESYSAAMSQVELDSHQLRVVYVTDLSWAKPSVPGIEVFAKPIESYALGENMGIRPRLGSFLPPELLEDVDYIILANSDICVTPTFYDLVIGQIESGTLAGSINRRSILGVDPLDTGALDRALKTSNWYLHSGSDCFFFPATSGNFLRKSRLFMGAPPVGRHVVVTLSALNPSFRVYEDLAATFHFGDDRFWAESKTLLKLKDLNFVYWCLELCRILPIVGGRNLLRGIKTPIDGPVTLPSLAWRFLQSLLGIASCRK